MEARRNLLPNGSCCLYLEFSARVFFQQPFSDCRLLGVGRCRWSNAHFFNVGAQLCLTYTTSCVEFRVQLSVVVVCCQVPVVEC
jgi:hypothetical protein